MIPEPTSRPYGLRLPTDLADALDQRCAQANVPRSRVIIAAVREYLALPAPETAVQKAPKPFVERKVS